MFKTIKWVAIVLFLFWGIVFGKNSIQYFLDLESVKSVNKTLLNDAYFDGKSAMYQELYKSAPPKTKKWLEKKHKN